MRRCARPRLKALPILNPTTFSLRSVIPVLLTISESSSFIEATTRAVLDELSDAELEKHTKPKEITSISEARAYLANIKTQSSEYTWIRNGPLNALPTRYRTVTTCLCVLRISTGIS